MKTLRWMALCLLALLLSKVAHADLPGVSDTEIRVGSVLDLSGPIAMLGAPVRDGITLRFEQANAEGGVHGRRLTLVLEDSAYDPKRAVLATRKLLQKDNVFAFLSNMGTPVVMATLPMIVEAGRPHLFPFSPHESTYTPLHPLKFQMFAPYQDYMAAAVRHLVSENGYKRVGLLYQDDEYGLEVMKGVEQGLALRGLALVEKTGYKRGATDFSAQIARLRAANADLVVLATVVRETVGAVAQARKIGWPVDMLVTASGYSAQVPELGGAAMDGLYGVSVLPLPYAQGASPELAAWIEAYTRRFGAAPNIWSAMAYTGADLLVRALTQAGPTFNIDGFIKAMENLPPKADFFDGPTYHFSADNHLGNHKGRLARIESGRWVLLTDYLD
jgi:branched-chain amino acid transport system substrate-binding protein